MRVEPGKRTWPRSAIATRPVHACACALAVALGFQALGCRGERTTHGGPDQALAAFVEAARARDAEAARAGLTARTLALFGEFERKASAIEATNAPPDVLRATLDGFATERPAILECTVEGERAECRVRYRSGREAKLATSREEGVWKLDLEPPLRASIDLLDGAGRIRESMSDSMKAQGPRGHAAGGSAAKPGRDPS